MSYANNDDDEDDQKSGVRMLFAGKSVGDAPAPSDVSVRRTGLTPLNSGGTITRGGQTQSYAPSAYSGTPASAARTTAGLPVSPPAIRSTLTPALPPATPAALSAALPTPGAPVASPSTAPAVQQKESANPLSGDGNAQPPGTSDSLPPISAVSPAPISAPAARQMAGGLFSQRGNGVPRGRDIHAPLPIRSLFRRR